LKFRVLTIFFLLWTLNFSVLISVPTNFKYVDQHRLSRRPDIRYPVFGASDMCYMTCLTQFMIYNCFQHFLSLDIELSTWPSIWQLYLVLRRISKQNNTNWLVQLSLHLFFSMILELILKIRAISFWMRLLWN